MPEQQLAERRAERDRRDVEQCWAAATWLQCHPAVDDQQREMFEAWSDAIKRTAGAPAAVALNDSRPEKPGTRTCVEDAVGCLRRSESR